MYFTEKGLLDSKRQNVTVKVCLLSGSEVDFVVSANSTVAKLKEEALEALEVVAKEKMWKSVNFSVLQLRSGKVLADADLVDGVLLQADELLLIPRRGEASCGSAPGKDRKESVAADGKDEAGEGESKGPSRSEIVAATSRTTSRHSDRRPKEHLKNLEFTTELQKILVTFVETSLKLLSLDPQAHTILTEIQGKVLAVIEPRDLLLSLGYSQDQVNRALHHTDNNVSSAREWLASHENTRTGEDVDMRENEGSLSQDSYELLPNYNIPVSAAAILKAFKEFQRKRFKPNEDALKHFKDMGFEETRILDALRESGNNEDVACDVLLGERIASSVTTLQGLDPHSSIYKAILSNPTIISNLSNPKNLNIFLNMLENIQNLRTNAWIADPDISPLFSQVFRVYHTENYTLK